MHANYQNDILMHVSGEENKSNKALWMYTNISQSAKECSVDTQLDFYIF